VEKDACTNKISIGKWQKLLLRFWAQLPCVLKINLYKRVGKCDCVKTIYDFGSKGAVFFGVVKWVNSPPKVTRFQHAITFVLLGVIEVEEVCYASSDAFSD